MIDNAKELLDETKETIKSVVATSTERLNNPLLGPFIISIIVYNWRPLAILFFSNKTIDCKINIIDEKYCGLAGLFWPIIVAFIYYVAVPIIIVGCEQILLPMEKIRIWIKYKRLGKEAEEEKAYQAVRSENKEVEALNNEIKNLRGEMALMIDTHNTTINRYAKQIEDLNRVNTKNEKGILNLTKNTSTNYKKFAPLLESRSEDFIISLRELSQNLSEEKGIPPRIFMFLNENNFLDKNSNKIAFNDLGREFLKYIQTNYVVTNKS